MKLWETTEPIWLGGREVVPGTRLSLTSNQSKYIKHALTEPRSEAPSEDAPPAEPVSEVFEDEVESFSKASRRKRKGAADGDVD